MRLPQRYERGRLDVTMTPMIDVVFLLLVFFIWTSSFQPPEDSLPTTLSLQGSNVDIENLEPEDDAEEPIVIGIRSNDGSIVWNVRNNNFQAAADLENYLIPIAAVDNQLPVILNIAAEIPLGEVVQVYDLSRRVGFERIQFAASVPVD